MFNKIEIVETNYPGARAGDDESWSLFVNGEQFRFGKGDWGACRTKGNILEAFVKTLTDNYKHTRKDYEPKTI